MFNILLKSGEEDCRTEDRLFCPTLDFDGRDKIEGVAEKGEQTSHHKVA